jgi:hypothetical protein
VNHNFVVVVAVVVNRNFVVELNILRKMKKKVFLQKQEGRKLKQMEQAGKTGIYFLLRNFLLPDWNDCRKLVAPLLLASLGMLVP